MHYIINIGNVFNRKRHEELHDELIGALEERHMLYYVCSSNAVVVYASSHTLESFKDALSKYMLEDAALDNSAMHDYCIVSQVDIDKGHMLGENLHRWMTQNVLMF